MKKNKVLVMIICLVLSGSLFGCADSSGKENVNGNTQTDVTEEIEKEEQEAKEKEDDGKVEAEEDFEDNMDEVETKINYKEYYDGSNKLAIDFEGEGIGDSFLEYEFELISSGELKVRVSSLRGIFEGKLNSMPVENQWAGEIMSEAEGESISVGVAITEHAIKLMETENDATQETIFYLESQTFDRKYGDGEIESSKGKFSLEKTSVG